MYALTLLLDSSHFLECGGGDMDVNCWDWRTVEDKVVENFFLGLSRSSALRLCALAR